MNANHSEITANWTHELAVIFAKEYGIDLTLRHWEVIHIVRDLYFSHDRHPATRVFINAVKEKNSAATMLELIQLFGEKPLFALSYIAGLPKPPHCI